MRLDLHGELNLPRTAQGQILLEFDTLRYWELQRPHIYVITSQTPSEIVRCDQMLGEPTERVLVRDREVGCLVDICAFFLNAERLEAEKAQRDLLRSINPGNTQGFYEANLSREYASVRDLDEDISKVKLRVRDETVAITQPSIRSENLGSSR